MDVFTALRTISLLRSDRYCPFAICVFVLYPQILYNNYLQSVLYRTFLYLWTCSLHWERYHCCVATDIAPLQFAYLFCTLKFCLIIIYNMFYIGRFFICRPFSCSLSRIKNNLNSNLFRYTVLLWRSAVNFTVSGVESQRRPTKSIRGGGVCFNSYWRISLHLSQYCLQSAARNSVCNKHNKFQYSVGLRGGSPDPCFSSQ